jgi:hypothetical protein
MRCHFREDGIWRYQPSATRGMFSAFLFTHGESAPAADGLRPRQLSFSDAHQIVRKGDGSYSRSEVRGGAAGPSAEGMAKVRRFAESHEFGDVFRTEFRGAEIFLREVAANIIQNLCE